MKFTILEKEHQFDSSTDLKSIALKLNVKDALAATVNKRLRELSYIPTHDADVEFLTYTHADAIRIYESTLRYIIAMAVKNLYPNAKIRFNYSISRSILAVFDDFDGILNQQVLDDIEKEVQRIIKADYLIERKRISLGEAMKLYRELDLHDKVDILKYREEDYVNLYECHGYTNYMFGYMLPSTGYISTFNFILYHPGFLIQYPRAEMNGQIPVFHDEPTFGKALKEARKWGKIISGNTIPKMNEFAKDHTSSVDFVNM